MLQSVFDRFNISDHTISLRNEDAWTLICLNRKDERRHEVHVASKGYDTIALLIYTYREIRINSLLPNGMVANNVSCGLTNIQVRIRGIIILTLEGSLLAALPPPHHLRQAPTQSPYVGTLLIGHHS